MNGFYMFLCLAVSLAESAPLYGEDGGYQGFASYQPLKKGLRRAGEDSIKASAGSPEISQRPAKDEDTSAYVSDNLPKKYNILTYIPSYQHGYVSNNVSEEILAAPYHRATIYGQENNAYKIGDVFQSQPADSQENDGYKTADEFQSQPADGQENDGYKIADAFESQPADSQDSNKHDYSDEHYSNPQPYEYGYVLKDAYGNSQHRHETSDGHGNVKGAYGFVDEHGLYRSVEYVAGKDGFKAFVKTNEPGTENENPADVHVESESSSEQKYSFLNISEEKTSSHKKFIDSGGDSKRKYPEICENDGIYNVVPLE